MGSEYFDYFLVTSQER